MRRAILVAVLSLCVAASGYANCITLTFITESLPTFYVGVPVSFQIEASGGTTPYTFTLVGGSSLPPGLSMSSSGLITGTPTTAMYDTIFVRVTDANNCVLTQAFAVAVEF